MRYGGIHAMKALFLVCGIVLHIERTAAILCEENGSGHELLNQETHSEIFLLEA